MKTLHNQLTKVSSVIHTTSPLFQARCCAKFSRPRVRPETIKQRKPAQTMYWWEYPLAYLMIARAKNSPATVGMITLPIQVARLVMPLRKTIAVYIIALTSCHRPETVKNPPAAQTRRMDGLPNAKFRMAPTIASTAATGRIRLATYVHNPARTSVVANFVLEFHPCSSVDVVPTESRNIAPRMDHSGEWPSATSITARMTSHAAITGAKTPTTNELTKLVMSDFKAFKNAVPPPPEIGTATPKPVNQ